MTAWLRYRCGSCKYVRELPADRAAPEVSCGLCDAPPCEHCGAHGVRVEQVEYSEARP